jgi:hypothetical protein
MAEPLEYLARRLESDPFFLACPLKLYAKSEGIDERKMAERLACNEETLVRVKLCRAPSQEGFQKDIACIAARYKLHGESLADAVRRGQALYSMAAGSAGGTLLAARDGDTAERQDRGNAP